MQVTLGRSRNVKNCVAFQASKLVYACVFISETKRIVAVSFHKKALFIFKKDSFANKSFATKMT